MYPCNQSQGTENSLWQPVWLCGAPGSHQHCASPSWTIWSQLHASQEAIWRSPKFHWAYVLPSLPHKLFAIAAPLGVAGTAYKMWAQWQMLNAHWWGQWDHLSHCPLHLMMVQLVFTLSLGSHSFFCQLDYLLVITFILSARQTHQHCTHCLTCHVDTSSWPYAMYTHCHEPRIPYLVPRDMWLWEDHMTPPLKIL